MAIQGLKRVELVKNPNYKRNGLKSYGYLLRKYQIEPTHEGPFHWVNKPHHQGKFGSALNRIGGKTTMQHVLMQRSPEQLSHHHHHHHKPTEPPSGTTPPTTTPPTTTPPTTTPPTTTPPTTTPPATGSGSGTTPTTGQTGEVTATDIQNDSEYLCPVSIGTPAQTLMLDFDTGSADLWVWSTQLPSATTSQYGSSHTIFNPAQSSTFQNQASSSWQIQYGDGSTASGTVGTDNVTIGGLTITNQAVELANTLSAQFASGAGDGLLGLAFGSINTVTPTPVQTPVENMISQQDIPASSELFTAYLGSWRDTNDPDKGESFYTFGFIDPDVLQAENTTAENIHYTPVDNSQGFWMFASTSASVNGTSIALSGNTAIADTGTTLALVSDSVCKAIYAAIPGGTYDSTQQGYVFPSTVTADQLPVVQFDVGGQLFTVQKEDLSFADAGNGMVYGGVQSRGSQTFDILGDTFLKSIYAIFDQGNTRFGAVQRTVATQNVSLPPSSST